MAYTLRKLLDIQPMVTVQCFTAFCPGSVVWTHGVSYTGYLPPAVTRSKGLCPSQVTRHSTNSHRAVFHRILARQGRVDAQHLLRLRRSLRWCSSTRDFLIECLMPFASYPAFSQWSPCSVSQHSAPTGSCDARRSRQKQTAKSLLSVPQGKSYRSKQKPSQWPASLTCHSVK